MLLNIANLLLREKLLKYEDINSILENNSEISIEDFQNSLISSGIIEREVLEEIIKKNFNTSIEDIKDLKIDESVLRIIKKKTAAANMVLPLRVMDEKLVVAMTDPTDLILIDELSFESGYNIVPVIASKEIIRDEVIRNYKIDLKVHGELLDSAMQKQTGEAILSKLKESSLENGNSDLDEITIQEKPSPLSERSANTADEIPEAFNPFKSAVIKNKVELNNSSETEPAHSPENIDIGTSANPFSSSARTASEPEPPEINDIVDQVVPETKTEVDEVNPFASPSSRRTETKAGPENILIGNIENTKDNNNTNPFQSPVTAIPETKTTETNPFETAGEEFSVTAKQVEEKVEDTQETVSEAVYSTSVLVVDKSRTTREIITETLEEIGYKVILSGDAIDAMSKINKSRPDIVLVDINLPHLDGYQLCKIIKKNSETKDLPVVMLSGKDGIFDKMKGKIAGASEYITKPFRPSELIEVVRSLTRT